MLKLIDVVKLDGVSLLTTPSKMPCPSFSLPAGPACPYAVYKAADSALETICGGCYAKDRGTYSYDNVKHAQGTRFDFLRDCTKRHDFSAFVEMMVSAIDANDFIREYVCKTCGNVQRTWNRNNCVLCGDRTDRRLVRNGYFRVHDSGDFFNADYVMAWYEICMRLPHIKFWIPTRAWQPRNPWRNLLVLLNALPNVAVRPSALFFDTPPPMIDGLSAGTSASATAFNCPASLQNNECGDCRQCWEKTIPIIYHKH